MTASSDDKDSVVCVECGRPRHDHNRGFQVAIQCPGFRLPAALSESSDRDAPVDSSHENGAEAS